MDKKITELIRGEVDTSTETKKAYSRDASLFSVTPSHVTFPKDVDDISALIQHAKNSENVSLTARSGGTDMSGGPLSNSVVMDMTRYFNRIVSVVENEATVQPGVYYRDFERETLKHNLLMPSYPASREICTVGGMVANNSGGEKTLAYGKTNKYVKRLKVVLADGKEYVAEPLSRRELEHTISKQDFEGIMYRKLFELIEKNFERIQQARPNVSKNSAGYNLWDVWQPDHDKFDLTQLLTGSQGTLGIITEITFHLITPKPRKQMLVIFLDQLDHLAEIVKHVLNHQPESFESYDDHTLKLSLKFLPDLVKRLSSKNLLKLAINFLPEVRMIITGGIPQMVLLAEFTGDSEKEIKQRAQAAQQSLAQFNVKSRLTKSEDEAEKYWVMRRESFNILRHHVQGKRTAPFIDDIIVRPEQLPQFLPRLDDIMDDFTITYTIAGHIGDANFHIIPLIDVTRPNLVDVIKTLSERVYDLVIEFGGSIDAEHNDGIIRTPWLEKMYGKEIYNLFEETKKIFDPENIFNPGKKVGGTWQYAMDHLIHKN